MSNHHVITSAEWRWLIILSTLVMALICLPYLMVYLVTPAGWQFAWLLPNITDAHSYFSKMRQGYEGSWQFHLTYTAEPHDGAYIFTFYLFLGHLARALHLPIEFVFHAARVLSGWGLLLTLYQFIAHITPDLRERRLAFSLLITSSGLGWLVTLIGGSRSPIDLWLPEAFIPYTLYANPHFPFATMLMLQLLQAVVWPRQHFIWVIALAITLVLVQPFAILTVWVILATFALWLGWQQRAIPYQQVKSTLLTILITLPVIVYDYQVTQINPIMAGWAAQNITTAPPLIDILLGYGLLGILAIAGVWWVIRQKNGSSAEWLLLIWLGSILVAIYLPFALQRRVIHGLHIPIGILAALALRRAWPNLKSRWRNRLTLGVMAMGFIATLFVYSIPLATALQLPAHSRLAERFFLRNDEVLALNWLNQHATSDQVVLASPRLGMFIPSQSHTKTYYGHLYETVQSDQKRRTVEAFYRGELTTLPPYVDFIIYGPSEQALGQPSILATLPVVFAINTVTIYHVSLDGE